MRGENDVLSVKCVGERKLRKKKGLKYVEYNSSLGNSRNETHYFGEIEEPLKSKTCNR